MFQGAEVAWLELDVVPSNYVVDKTQFSPNCASKELLSAWL